METELAIVEERISHKIKSCGGVVHMAECLSNKLKALSPNPKPQIKNTNNSNNRRAQISPSDIH
jgi:hypothetical protein